MIIITIDFLLQLDPPMNFLYKIVDRLTNMAYITVGADTKTQNTAGRLDF